MRKEKYIALSAFLQREFSKRGVLTSRYIEKDIAEISVLVLEKELQAKKTSKRDRIFSLYKHLHAYAEGLKPYGVKSRRVGFYQLWIKEKYGRTTIELIEVTIKILGEKNN